MIFTFLDIETNSLDKTFGEILEVGYIQTNRDLNVLRHGELYFYKPEWDLGRTDIHHLTRGYLEKHIKEFDENLVKLNTIMAKGIIIGKNSGNLDASGRVREGFDIPFIHSFMNRHAGEIAITQLGGTLDLQTYCAPYYREWIAKVTGIQPSSRKQGTLKELVGMAGFTQEQIQEKYKLLFPDSDRCEAHGALYDAFMTFIVALWAKENANLKL